jgi:hypothetical protein
MPDHYDQREDLHAATQPKTPQGSTVALIRMDGAGNITYGGEPADILKLCAAIVEGFGEKDGQE